MRAPEGWGLLQTAAQNERMSNRTTSKKHINHHQDHCQGKFRSSIDDQLHEGQGAMGLKTRSDPDLVFIENMTASKSYFQGRRVFMTFGPSG